MLLPILAFLAMSSLTLGQNDNTNRGSNQLDIHIMKAEVRFTSKIITCDIVNVDARVNFRDDECVTYLYVNDERAAYKYGKRLSHSYEVPIRARLRCDASCFRASMTEEVIIVSGEMTVMTGEFVGLIIGLILLLILLIILVCCCCCCLLRRCRPDLHRRLQEKKPTLARPTFGRKATSVPAPVYRAPVKPLPEVVEINNIEKRPLSPEPNQKVIEFSKFMYDMPDKRLNPSAPEKESLLSV